MSEQVWRDYKGTECRFDGATLTVDGNGGCEWAKFEMSDQNREAIGAAMLGATPTDAIIRERQLIALYLHSFAGSQVDPVEVAEAVLTGAHMVAT